MSNGVPTGLVCPHFPISEILLATQDFNQELLIGLGGFGKVYKGTMKNETETIVAIKRLDSGSAQGATEFWAEVEILSMLRHCNLVSLIGYCNDNKEMILVYEYMPNGTLSDHLHKLHTPLSFSQRLKICIGAARGLQYLHTGTGIEVGIIHRDVKSSNILLGNNWEARVSDFGLSKISPIDKPLTGVSTLIKGTFGYIDPNYFSTGRLTRKSDVFSFGVILLEVLCRKRAVDSSLDEEQWSLVEWAQDFLRGGKLKEIVDPYLKMGISRKCLNNYAKLVEGCLRSSPKLRITMAEVVCGLESILALHEKSNTSIPEMGLITFGRMFVKSLFSTEENYAVTNEATTSGESHNLNYARAITSGESHNLNYANNNKGKRRSTLKSRPKNALEDTVRWPGWLDAAAGEVLKGWLPRRAETFSKDSKIRQGHNSTVFKGRDMLTGNVVALKKVNFDYLDPQSVEKVVMEIAILRRLDHPNVIKLEGIIISQMSSSLYLIFEYMDHDLAALSGDPAMQFTEHQIFLNMVDQALYAPNFLWSEYCHDHQVLHRDLQPSNLLVDNNGVLKIADFDSASFFNLIHKQPLTNRVTTYWLQAPELLLGATEYGVGVDLWSVGCILSGLLAKRPILAGHTEAEQLQKIYQLCGPPPDEYWKTVKTPLKTLYNARLQFRRCLTETFKDFPPSSLSLLDVLLSVDPAKRQNAASAMESKFLSETSEANESQITKMEFKSSSTYSSGLGY